MPAIAVNVPPTYRSPSCIASVVRCPFGPLELSVPSDDQTPARLSYIAMLSALTPPTSSNTPATYMVSPVTCTAFTLHSPSAWPAPKWESHLSSSSMVDCAETRIDRDVITIVMIATEMEYSTVPDLDESSCS